MQGTRPFSGCRAAMLAGQSKAPVTSLKSTPAAAQESLAQEMPPGGLVLLPALLYPVSSPSSPLFMGTTF